MKTLTQIWIRALEVPKESEHVDCVFPPVLFHTQQVLCGRPWGSSGSWAESFCPEGGRIPVLQWGRTHRNPGSLPVQVGVKDSTHHVRGGDCVLQTVQLRTQDHRVLCALLRPDAAQVTPGSLHPLVSAGAGWCTSHMKQRSSHA